PPMDVVTVPANPASSTPAREAERAENANTAIHTRLVRISEYPAASGFAPVAWSLLPEAVLWRKNQSRTITDTQITSIGGTGTPNVLEFNAVNWVNHCGAPPAMTPSLCT